MEDKVIRYLPVTYTFNEDGDKILNIESPVNIENVVTINGLTPEEILDLIPSGAVLGEFRMFPFTPENLPDGWVHADGTKLVPESEAAKQLLSLGEPYLGTWSKVTDDYVQLPDLVRGTGGYTFISAGSVHNLGEYND